MAAVKVWITKYTLTQGVYVASGEMLPSGNVRVRGDYSGKVRYDQIFSPSEFRTSEAEAIERAKAMRDRRIKKLKEDLKILESNDFNPKQFREWIDA